MVAMSRGIAHGMRVLAWQIRIGWKALLRQPARRKHRTNSHQNLWPAKSENITEPRRSEKSKMALDRRAASVWRCPLTRRANRDRLRRTAPGSPRLETRLSSDRRCGKMPERPRVRARAREPGVRLRLDS